MRRSILLGAVLVIALTFAGGSAASAHWGVKPPSPPRVTKPVVCAKMPKAGVAFRVTADIKPAQSKDTTLVPVFEVLKWDGAQYSFVSTAAATFYNHKRGCSQSFSAKLMLPDAGFYKLRSVLLSDGAVVATSCATPVAVWPVEPPTDPGTTP